MLGVQVPSFLCGVWPSGKAPVFGTGIKGSNPFTPDQSGGIGRHAGFRFQFERIGVQVPSLVF